MPLESIGVKYEDLKIRCELERQLHDLLYG